MSETETLIELLKNKEKLVAMLAPSYPIMFEYPAVITMLKQLGFTYVAEVAAGAQKTNTQLLQLMKEHPKARYITSPCPTIVRMVKKIMPQYTKYFTTGVDSPMIATAKMVYDTYPGYQPVFIGPCVMKKIEAKEDAPELNILVLTYSELLDVFTHFSIGHASNPNDRFDIASEGPTRIYPVDGGLSLSSGLTNLLPQKQIKAISGAQNDISAIKEFDINPDIKLLDILNCPGGCIGGPGIRSPLTREERREKIMKSIGYTPVSI